MSENHLDFKLIIKTFATFYLLTWNVDAYFATNRTLVDWLNSQNLTWKAGLNPTNYPPRVRVKMPRKVGGPMIKPARIKVPGTFDSRLHWKGCKEIISRIRDQGQCGSCWAVAGASMLSDRMCIGTNFSKRVHLSGEHLTTCCKYCLAKKRKICQGGDPYDAAKFWVKHGVVTGGELDSNEGCKPYSRNLYKGRHVSCARRCTNKGYSKKYKEDKHKGKSAYYIHPGAKYIMREIFRHGPVVAVFYLYKDFDYYRKGVYRYRWGEFDVAHAVKIIGWGRESGQKYWLVANNWGPKWALLKGYFKIVRGENHCMIEQWAIGGRMSEVSLARETLAEADANCANKRSLFLVQRLLLHAFCIWMLKDIL